MVHTPSPNMKDCTIGIRPCLLLYPNITVPEPQWLRHHSRSQPLPHQPRLMVTPPSACLELRKSDPLAILEAIITRPPDNGSQAFIRTGYRIPVAMWKKRQRKCSVFPLFSVYYTQCLLI